MTDIAQLILDYPDLAAAQRAQLEAYVALHQEWLPDLEEARALAAVLDAASTKHEDRAAQLVDERLGHAPMSLAPTTDDEADAGLRSRLDLLAAEGEEPLSQFERLTGRKLLAVPSGPTADVPRGLRDSRPAADRSAAPPARRARALRRAAMLLGTVAIAYAALFTASSMLTTERSRIADIASLAGYAPPSVRGTSPHALADRLDQALTAASGARQSVLGLFPSYDSDALDVVADSLIAISADARPESDVAQESRIALGRIRFQQERDADAVRILGQLVREGNYRASDARRLLDAIR